MLSRVHVASSNIRKTSKAKKKKINSTIFDIGPYGEQVVKVFRENIKWDANIRNLISEVSAGLQSIKLPDDTKLLSSKESDATTASEKSLIDEDIAKRKDDTKLLSPKESDATTASEKSLIDEDIAKRKDDTKLLPSKESDATTASEKSFIDEDIAKRKDDTKLLPSKESDATTASEKSLIDEDIAKRKDDTKLLSSKESDATTASEKSLIEEDIAKRKEKALNLTKNFADYTHQDVMSDESKSDLVELIKFILKPPYRVDVDILHFREILCYLSEMDKSLSILHFLVFSPCENKSKREHPKASQMDDFKKPHSRMRGGVPYKN